MNEEKNKCIDCLKCKHFELTWDWFKYHANQRMQTFYYYLLIIGALSWGFQSSLSGCEQAQILAPFIALLAMLASVVFFFIEVRNVELVNIGRKLLIKNNDFEALIIDGVVTKKDVEALKEQMDKGAILRIKEESFRNNYGLPYFKIFVRHEFCLRFVYLLCLLYGGLALIYSISYLNKIDINGNIYLWAVAVAIILLVLFVSRHWKRATDLI